MNIFFVINKCRSSDIKKAQLKELIFRGLFFFIYISKNLKYISINTSVSKLTLIYRYEKMELELPAQLPKRPIC